jgi:uroporphyrinogen decarboxylase
MKTPSERFASTIRMEKPEPRDLVPIWELEFHGWNLFSPHKLVVGHEFSKLSPRDKEKALHRNAEIFCTVSQDLKFSAITVPGGYWEIAPGHPAYFWLPGEARIQQIEILRKKLEDKIMLVAGNPAVLAMPGADEYMQFAYTLMEHPEEIEKRAKELYEKGIREADRLIDLGIGALYTPSDIADNHGPYFNPGQMEQLILPFLDQWATFVKNKGALAILHSDGNLESILELIANTGIQAIQAIDPTAGMDLKRTFEAVEGKLALCGNIDCGLYTGGNPDQLFAATKEALALKNQGGLILGASNAIEKELKKENYLSFLQAWKEFGVY